MLTLPLLATLCLHVRTRGKSWSIIRPFPIVRQNTRSTYTVSDSDLLPLMGKILFLRITIEIFLTKDGIIKHLQELSHNI